ncbi:amidohydrolase [uncultured Agrococcus sp.]|uniref:amidohydrolase n=1 Tax=uncultured Agrococcus sp. TaxID=382258 RepID=UPI0025EA61D1|nr:amidohydrolase [uncultured Agrococcus sp.]
MTLEDFLPGLTRHASWQLRLYTDLHRQPELSGEEKKTAVRVEQELQDLGLETRRFGGTGVVAALENGEGPTVLGRADLDALPVMEATGLDYASETPGVMHACGHDAHVAGLMGAVRALHEQREHWRGTYIAVFQPAEELGSGAHAMVADGLTHAFPRPDACFAAHVLPGPPGQVLSAPGPVMSALDVIRVVVYGRGGHGSMPHLTVDPVVLAAAIVQRLQGIVAREIAPGTFAIVTVGSLHAGSTSNIISNSAELQVDVRSYDEDVQDRLRAAVERIVRAECAASGSPREPEFHYDVPCPVTVNDAGLTATVSAAFRDAFGQDAVPASRVTASEDFDAIPAAFDSPYCYWFVGSTPHELWEAATAGEFGADIPSNHSPAFAPAPEPTLERLSASHIAAALTLLRR